MTRKRGNTVRNSELPVCDALRLVAVNSSYTKVFTTPVNT
jgi:hypothetical protein